MLIILLVIGLAALVAIPWANRLPAHPLALAPAAAFVWVLQAPAGLEEVYPWVPTLGVQAAFRLDGLARLFALMVLGIGALVVLYAAGYMAHAKRRGRFFGILLGFMASMLGVVLADDALTLFVFWELTSLTSYLLIGFEPESPANRVAARKALVVTGFGGLALLGGLLLLTDGADSLRLSALIESRPEVGGLAFALVLIGAFTKSAQFPFHFWLPAAMAGPTPVSAYLHSATMVKAGVFLLARFSPLMSSEPAWGPVLVLVGGATMVLSAWQALRDDDLKGLLAYTTSMALGLFVMLLGVGTEAAVHGMVAYLVVHAAYKGGLFMVAGNVDHEAGTRDLRRLSGLGRKLPFTAAAAVLSAAAMAGLPPFLGFVGKEVIYEAGLHGPTWATVALIMAFLANVALVAASAKVALSPFFGPPMEGADRVHEAGLDMVAGPLALGLFGLGAGLACGALDRAVLAEAAAAIRAPAPAEPLALWHGLNLPLGLSAVTVAAGALVYRLRVGGPRLLDPLFARGPARAFEHGLRAGSRAAMAFLDVTHPGRLRFYLAAVLVTLLAVAALTLPGDLPLAAFGAEPSLRPDELGLLALMVVAAAVAVRQPRSVPAVLGLSVTGYAVALLYLVFGAPDLALTQFAVESLTVILLVLTLLHLPPRQPDRPPRRAGQLRDLALSLGVGGLTAYVGLVALAQPLDLRLSEYFVEHSYEAAHGHNVVNVILVDFRGFDTFGEITVLTLAGLGVVTLLAVRRRARAS